MKNDGLDPQDWDEYRAAAHRLLDQCIDRLASARDLPWQPVPQATREAYALTGAGSTESALAARIARDILPYGHGNTHPAFFGWVRGTGLATGIMSEMAVATMNANTGGGDHGAIYLERAVIDWAKGVFDFPETASGLLLTGTSQATVVALSAARVRALGPQVRAQGNGAAYLTAYAGAGVHNAARKGLEVLGIGSDNLRLIPDGANGIDIAHLTQAIATDRAAGATPFAIVGTAGSVDLGHFDDLNALADLAAAQSLWFHIDCAFGAWTRLADAPWRALSDGINRADSLACDFHKWMYVPYDCGMVLIRDEAEHRAAFASRPAYLAAQDMGLGANEPWFCDYGTDLSRGNRALKVWSAIETYGTARLGAAITDNCRMAALMGALASQPPMRLMASVVSNVCVFTANADLPAQAQSALNTHIAHALQLQGIAVFSTTKIDDIICLRAAIANHRTRKDDVITAMNAVRKLALGA